MSGMGIHLPRRPRYTDETRPQTFDDMVDSLEGQRVAGWWRGLGVIALLVAMPMLTGLAATIGQRAREQNCRVVRQALVGENAGIISTFAAAAVPPDASPEDIAGIQVKATAALSALDANVIKIMAACNG